MSNKDNFEIFPTLVTRYSNFLNPDELFLISEYCLNQSKRSNHISLVGDSYSNHLSSESILIEISNSIPRCKDLLDKINNTVDSYTSDTGIPSTLVSNSWFNIQNQGSVLKQHIHPLSILSGALYINVDKNASRIYFENPNPFVAYFNQTDSTNIKKYTYEHVYYEPTPGDLFIFPSWLKHGSLYEKNYFENRIVISFNTNRVIK
jgi:uncharacterized protein (TIGR02466 family)